MTDEEPSAFDFKENKPHRCLSRAAYLSFSTLILAGFSAWRRVA